MKRFSLFLIATILFSVSCTKTSTVTPGTGTTTPGANTFTCKINGSSFTPSDLSASYQYILLTLTGKSGDFLTKIDFNATVSGKVGTYDLKDNANFTNNTKISPAVYGVLNLTKFDATLRLVSGTFSYTTKDSTRITEGVFVDVGY